LTLDPFNPSERLLKFGDFDMLAPMRAGIVVSAAIGVVGPVVAKA